MPPLDRAHPVNPDGVRSATADALVGEDAARLARLLTLLADPVRLRLLFALVAVDELCVGDLALTLGDASDDQVSYALKLLRNADLVQTRREGRIIHYRLADGFPQALLEHCLRQLLTITQPTAPTSND